MSLFPLGVVFYIVGLLLYYFLEIVHLGFYKRPEILNSRLCKCFVYNFKVAMAVFAIGNYIFLHDVDKHSDINWSLINLILFIVIVFIPYDSIKFNLLGVKEGEITKGSYDEYELMFPTDYEKQNPLTKKKAMIKYFKKLEKMSLIDKYQSNYLINNTNKESYMDNYYKTSKNIGNLLNSYEFQRQFIKSKKKYKFMKKIKQRKILLESQSDKEYNIFTENINNNINYNNLNLINNSIKSFNTKKRVLTYTDTKKINGMGVIKEEENDNSKNSNDYNNDYDVSTIIEKDKTKKSKKERTSKYMRKTLFQQIKNEGLYDDSEEENEDESFESDKENDNMNNNIINNRKKEGFEFSLLSDGLNNLNNNLNSIRNRQNWKNEDMNDKKTEISLYSIKTDFRDKDININNINNYDNEIEDNNL